MCYTVLYETSSRGTDSGTRDGQEHPQAHIVPNGKGVTARSILDFIEMRLSAQKRLTGGGCIYRHDPKIDIGENSQADAQGSLRSSGGSSWIKSLAASNTFEPSRQLGVVPCGKRISAEGKILMCRLLLEEGCLLNWGVV